MKGSKLFLFPFFKNAITQLSRLINRAKKDSAKVPDGRHATYVPLYIFPGPAGAWGLSAIISGLVDGTNSCVLNPEGASFDISGDAMRCSPGGDCLTFVSRARVPKSPLMRLRHVSLLRDRYLQERRRISTAQVRLACKLCQRSPPAQLLTCIVCVGGIFLASTPKFSRDVSKYIDDKEGNNGSKI